MTLLQRFPGGVGLLSRIALVAVLALVASGTWAARSNATAYQVCGLIGLGGYQAGDHYCNYGQVEPIDYIEIGAADGSMAVYRATSGALGAPSASGQEYYNSGGYFSQSFHCLAGYPAEHNRHSYSVYVYFVTAYDCI